MWRDRRFPRAVSKTFDGDRTTPEAIRRQAISETFSRRLLKEVVFLPSMRASSVLRRHLADIDVSSSRREPARGADETCNSHHPRAVAAPRRAVNNQQNGRARKARPSSFEQTADFRPPLRRPRQADLSRSVFECGNGASKRSWPAEAAERCAEGRRRAGSRTFCHGCFRERSPGSGQGRQRFL